jgi:hypothetical protein
MKHFTLLRLIGLGVIVGIFALGSSSGPAGAGNFFTGAPSTGGGTEGTCNTCHSSGASDFGEPVVTWNISETDGGSNVTSYTPGQTYFVNVTVTAPDATVTPAAFGFSSLFLDDTAAPNGASAVIAGTFTNNDSKTRFTNNNGRTYVEHNSRTESGSWSFQWTAPAMGFGLVKIYSSGNIVNSNFGTSGDSGSTSSTVVDLIESSTLPVSLSSFTAESVKSSVNLDWITETEDNSSHFSVERSSDGTTFTTIDRVLAAGISERLQRYSLTDEEVPASQQFYRLNMVDLDGASAYSQVVSVVINASTGLSIYPNPAEDFVTLQLDTEETATIRLLSANGRVIRNGLAAGQHDVSNLKPGIYLLEISTKTGRTVERLVKR